MGGGRLFAKGTFTDNQYGLFNGSVIFLAFLHDIDDMRNIYMQHNQTLAMVGYNAHIVQPTSSAGVFSTGGSTVKLPQKSNLRL